MLFTLNIARAHNAVTVYTLFYFILFYSISYILLFFILLFFMHQWHQGNFLYVQTYLANKRILILILILISSLCGAVHFNVMCKYKRAFKWYFNEVITDWFIVEANMSFTYTFFNNNVVFFWSIVLYLICSHLWMLINMHSLFSNKDLILTSVCLCLPIWKLQFYRIYNSEKMCIFMYVLYIWLYLYVFFNS